MRVQLWRYTKNYIKQDTEFENKPVKEIGLFFASWHHSFLFQKFIYINEYIFSIENLEKTHKKVKVKIPHNPTQR